MKTVIAAFEKEHPNIKVDVKPIPVSDVPNQVTIMATGGNPPDISQVQGDTVITLASSGFLEPVDDLIPKALLDDHSRKHHGFRRPLGGNITQSHGHRAKTASGTTRS